MKILPSNYFFIFYSKYGKNTKEIIFLKFLEKSFNLKFFNKY